MRTKHDFIAAIYGTRNKEQGAGNEEQESKEQGTRNKKQGTRVIH
jgi:hypothetical protein